MTNKESRVEIQNSELDIQVRKGTIYTSINQKDDLLSEEYKYKFILKDKNGKELVVFSDIELVDLEDNSIILSENLI